MALFDEQLITDTTELIETHRRRFAVALSEPEPDTEPVVLSLHAALRLLMQVANGELSRTEASPALVADVEGALDAIRDLLFGTAYGIHAPMPNDFWQSDIGLLYSRVRWWLSGDELITISNAAALAFGENTQANRMRVVRAIDSGLLDSLPDPSVTNPQQNRRVLRPQVERWAALRQRPGTSRP